MRLFILTLTLMIFGTVWMLIELHSRTVESVDWCTEVGGVPLTERGHFLVCLKPDSIIERTE